MDSTALIAEKVTAVMEEMKNTGLWRKYPPAWVSKFEEETIATQNDFSEWLQFVYLPNLAQRGRMAFSGVKKNFIVPQAIRFFGDDLKKGKLLRLLIELDAM
jgi:uncharacterized protein YqcC (DUF446 family)